MKYENMKKKWNDMLLKNLYQNWLPFLLGETDELVKSNHALQVIKVVFE